MAGHSEWTCEGDPKDFRVGVDGDLTRYPAESHGCAMTEGVVFRLTQGGTAGVFFALVPAFIGRDKGFFVSAERER